MNAELQKELYAVLEELEKYTVFAGGAVAVVRGGETVLKETFGVRDVETGEKVTDKTVFAIASDSKAFTTVLVSMLCEQGLLDWDAPIRRYLPSFFLGDDYISEHLTLRDAASHRSGLTSHNMLRRSTPGEIRSRKEYVERISHMALCSGFRETFHYQNELYAVLGYVAEVATGKTYEELIDEYIAAPLGLRLFYRGLPDGGLRDVAEPHLCHGDSLTKTTPDVFPHNNPCGGIRTDISSMEKWLRFLVRGGVTENGRRLLSEASFRNLYAPNAFWNFLAGNNRMRSYGLGLAPSVYRGELLVYHGGSLGGYRSSLGFFPERDGGGVVLLNSNTMPLVQLMQRFLRDASLGRMPDCRAQVQSLSETYLASLEREREKKKPHDPQPESVLRPLCGAYWNPAYHDLTVEENGNGGLAVTYGIDTADIYSADGRNFTGSFRKCGVSADCRWNEDGSAAMSFCDCFSPDLFTRKDT